MNEGRQGPGSGSTPPGATESGLAFFGVITAGVSHELNNVISIIDQVAGLLEDQLAAVQVGQPLSTERLRDIQDRIQKQTQRGVTIISHLNRFAHSVDEPCCEFDLTAGVRNLLALVERFARLRRVQMQANYQDGEIRMTGNPFRMQQAVFLGLQGFLAAAEPSSAIAVTLARSGADARIEISGPEAGVRENRAAGVAGPVETAAREPSRRQTDFDEALRALAGRAEVRSDQGRRVLALTVPLMPS